MACGGCAKRRKEFLERQELKNKILQVQNGIMPSPQPAISTANHLTPQQIQNMAPIILMNQYKKPSPDNKSLNIQGVETPRQIRMQNRKRRIAIRNERIQRRIAKAEKIKRIKEQEALQASQNKPNIENAVQENQQPPQNNK